MRTIVITVLIASAGPAFAKPIPQVDVDQLCRQGLGLGGYSRPFEEQYDSCFIKQQRDYDEVKAVWDEIDDDEQERCLRANHSDLFFYYFLARCVKAVKSRLEYEERLRRVPRREFRY